MRLEPRILALSSLLVAGACTGDGKDPHEPNDENDNPDFWLVGDSGTMLGVAANGEASGYPLDAELDLLAIACFGRNTAYVVGDQGTVLQTRDAGQTWASLGLGPAFTGTEGWRALAPAEATPEGVETVWIVGDAGSVGLTRDGGQSWTRIEGPTGVLRGVATGPSGEEAIVVSRGGEIWRVAIDDAELVHQADAPLHGVAMSAHDDRVAAVGAAGTMLASEDGGSSWTAVDLSTTRDLHAVRVAGHEALTVAVGAGGVVVRVEAGVAEVTEVVDAEQGLYGFHLRDDGTGQAVGAAGVLLRTGDGGQTWQSVAIPTTQSLRGVDDFHDGGHF